MSNYIEYGNQIAFHPGYYIKELVDDSGLTQEDFSKRLDTTPKNLSKIINGEQGLSRDMALKLSRMLGTTVEYWLNLQKKYDTKIAEFESQDELVLEREIFKNIDYKYFRENFNSPELSRKVDDQIRYVREFLNISTLNVLKNNDLAVSYRSYSSEPSVTNIINSNIMVQISVNKTLEIESPRYNKKLFEEAIEYALTLTTEHKTFVKQIYDRFLEAGVVFVLLPNLKNSGINGATKKVGNRMMLMVNDRRAYSDTFWFTLLHECGHIINGDYGLTFDNEKGNEDAADKYAQDKLIDPEKYISFVDSYSFTEEKIRKFASEINRDPGIVLGRLQNDGYISYTTPLSKKLRKKYKVVVS
ncbi:MAG: HigA family addiction module antidote protein [Pseudobutyrivibrio sp.]|nr:HigA family addiction module antidote protein [Pseudobutyrivibrio sp.]